MFYIRLNLLGLAASMLVTKCDESRKVSGSGIHPSHNRTLSSKRPPELLLRICLFEGCAMGRNLAGNVDDRKRLLTFGLGNCQKGFGFLVQDVEVLLEGILPAHGSARC